MNALTQTEQKSMHTPGPWSAFTDDSGSRPHTNIVAVNPRTDCVFSLPGHHKRDPNVQLIAAAPELLDFIRQIAKRDPVFAKGHEKQVIADARALVAKAEGR